jgi:uncharacterized YigZ family protein
MEGFYTLLQKTIVEQFIEKSRFIGIGVPINAPEQIDLAMQTIRMDYPNARHYVYAYRLHNGSLEKSSDDGEPQGTGGRPVLDFLQHQNIWNILLVVVRYFGGVLLGTGGLTRAYGSTAKLVFNNENLVQLRLYHKYQLKITYEWYSMLKYQFEQHHWSVINEEFSEVVDILMTVPENETELFSNWIDNFTRKQVKPDDRGTAWG